ncbi:diguanylate cyclase [Marinobacter sp. F4206]|uniref:diguanylate cyclase n=1 Tax=Marinobacter sp. F4206 TaxID=2861777 RepID=UPI001C5FA17C|nr:diguanylate cyclase [Marinobacter sp. F4206]MBW4934762.1 diguanylate cyclase [Marinobacter sp. F4206]
MPEEKNSEVARKLELLKLRFKEKATTDIGLLRAAADRFRAGDFSASDIASVYHSLHRLAGSAGTFGFSALGEEARSLEIMLKPLADMDDDSSGSAIAAEQGRDVVNQAFVDRVAQLESLLSLEQGAPLTGDDASPRASAERSEESVVLIVDPDQDAARDLACGLEFHGFLANIFPSVESAVVNGLAGVSVMVVRDDLVIRESRQLGSVADKPPIICVGAGDSFSQRYRLAERGVDGFVCEPVDIPVLADYMERLITERDEGGSGRVMIVDDDPELLEHYGLVLEEGGMEVRRVNKPAEILSVLSEFRPDIVLMDVQMGTFTGPNLARMLRFDPEWLGLPIIFLSSEEDREFQVAALAKGGDDFLTKPVSDAFLLRAVKVRCYRARQLGKLASRDSLTGLLKHSVAKFEIQKEHARCQRLGQQSVVAMLDLDHFKQVNDRYGHRTGDLVIKGLANLLRHRLRKSDVIGRYGGEEFVVALPDCSVENARQVLQSVCDHMAGIIFTANGQEFTVTLSVGVAPLQNSPTGDDALEAADQALYRRKQSGRNGVMVSGDEPEPAGTVS